MNENSRTKNAVLNIVVGYLAQIGVLAISFVGRRIFLTHLSADYLGINGLYSNILTVLSLAELGLDAAVVYSLYKPVAENDIILVRSMLRYFKKIYHILAGCVFLIGIALIPFLHLIVNSDLEERKLVLYYIVFLSNTVASYFVAHKVALLSACQEQRIQKLITLSSTALLQIVYIIVLTFTDSYLVYILSMLFVTVASNAILSTVCTKIHKDVFMGKGWIAFDKKPILERVASTFLYKIGAVFVNSTDNILISALVSTTAVGLYSNYYTVVNAVQGFIAIITTSLISGVGNYAVTKNTKGQCKIFYLLLFVYHLIAAIGFIGFSLLFNEVIIVWVGPQFVFDNRTVFVIALNFYLTTAISPVWMFREANGLFSKVKYLLLIRACLNMVISVLLGKSYGVFGIFLATAISLLLTNFWYEPRILFGSILRSSVNRYWIRQAQYFAITALAFVICYGCVLKLGNGILFLGIKAAIVVVVTVLLFVVFNCGTDEFRMGLGILKNKM